MNGSYPAGESGESARRWALRSYLLLLSGAVLLPLVALGAFWIFAEVRAEIGEASATASMLADTVAARSERFLLDSERVLARIAARPAIRAMDPANPDPIIATFRNQVDLYPQYANIAVIDLAGRVIQSGLPQPGGRYASVAETEWFQKARSTGRFVVGEPFVGPITGKWVSVLAYPIRDASGELAGLLALPIDLSRYQHEVKAVSAPASAVITIVDHRGIVIARSRNPERWVGRTLMDAEIVRYALSRTRGRVRAHGIDGVDRVYGFTTIASSGWRVYAGIPAQEVFGPIREKVFRGILLALLVAGLAVLLGRRLARNITHPVELLAEAASAVAAGKLETRAPVKGPAEIAAVAIRFNEMLDVRSAAERALRASEDRLSGVIVSAMDGIITIDASQRIVLFNAAAERMFACSAEQALGTTLDRFIPERLRDSHREHVERFRESGVSNRTTGAFGALTGLRLTGEEFPIEASISRVVVAGETLATVIIRDISARISQERELAQSNRVYAALSQINLAIARAASREELFKQVCAALVSQGEFLTAWIGWHDPGTSTLVPAARAGAGADGKLAVPIRADDTPAGQGPTGTAFRENRPQIRNRFLEEPSTAPWRGEAERCGFRAAAAFPIRSMGEVVGTLTVYAGDVDHFQAKEVALLSDAAADVSFALDNLTREESRRDAERARREAEEHLRLVVDNMAEGLVIFTPDAEVLRWNPAALRIQGFASDQEARSMLPEMRELFDVFTPDGRLLLPEERPLGRFLRGETMRDVVLKIRRRDTGFTRVVSMSGAMVRKEGAEGLAFVTMNDITERVASQEALDRSEARARTVLSSLTEAVMFIDVSGKVELMNQSVERVLGRAAGELLDREAQLSARVVRGDGTPFPADHRPAAVALRTNEAVRDVEMGVLRPDGTLVWLSVNAEPVRDDSGAPAGVVVSLFDITGRRNAEARRSASEKMLSSIYEGVSEPVFYLSVENDGARFRFDSVNAAFSTVTGVPRESIVGRTVDEVIPAPSLQLVLAKYREAIQSGRTVRWEEVSNYPAGQLTGVVSITPVYDEAGQCRSMVGSVHDITARKRVEENLKQAHERLQILSKKLLQIQEVERRQLAVELHDEIGQVLSAAKINLQSLERFPDPAELSRRLGESVRIVDRALSQVRSLSLQLRPALLDDLGLAAAVRWLADQLAARAGWSLTIEDGVDGKRFEPSLEIACFRIAQEALNNALKHSGARAITIGLSVHEGELRLRVRDDGAGFDLASARERAVHGASLGILGMEERAVLASGGIEWRSLDGQGTEVHAWFPLTSQEDRP